MWDIMWDRVIPQMRLTHKVLATLHPFEQATTKGGIVEYFFFSLKRHFWLPRRPVRTGLVDVCQVAEPSCHCAQCSRRQLKRLDFMQQIDHHGPSAKKLSIVPNGISHHCHRGAPPNLKIQRWVLHFASHGYAAQTQSSRPRSPPPLPSSHDDRSRSVMTTNG
mmetsp:Transcript_2023/g.5693  ORF Transcript_2023/g.5693 Transcript_2023/m.5693 type:complete len:163 (-) Transcript_2023:154-642(-)